MWLMRDSQTTGRQQSGLLPAYLCLKVLPCGDQFGQLSGLRSGALINISANGSRCSRPAPQSDPPPPVIDLSSLAHLRKSEKG